MVARVLARPCHNFAQMDMRLFILARAWLVTAIKAETFLAPEMFR
jgi:hypothetical protein